MAFPTKPLSECARLASGGTPSKSNPTFWGGPIDWLTPKDMSRFDGNTQDSVTRAAIGNGTREASEDSLFIAVRGMSLHNEIRIVRPRRKMAFNQDIKAITPVAAVDGRFLHYALLAKVPELLDAVEAAGHGTGVLPTDKLNSLPIPDLPLSEQHAIAATLGARDDKIELNRKMNATLEAMTRALFRDWFVDFGPTRAKMEGREPYLSPDIWALFPDRLDDEGKPEGWEEARLSDFMTFWGGSQPPAKTFIGTPASGYVRLLQIRDFDTDKHLTFIPDSPRLRKVETDDICIGRYGSGSGDEKDSLGRLCRGLSGAINVALVKAIPSFDCLEWLATFIGSGDFRRAVSGGSARAVQAGFKKEDLDHIKIVRAPDDVHAAFEAFGRTIWDKKKQSLAESEALADTRDLLLPRLMSGELRVADLATIEGEASA